MFERRGVNRALVVLFGILAFLLTMILVRPVANYQTADTPDPERARFMLECTYDWNLSPQTCREILYGKDPPALVPEYDGWRKD